MAYETSLHCSVLKGTLATSQNLLRRLPATNTNGAAATGPKILIAAPSWSAERDVRPSFLGDQLVNFHLGYHKIPTMELDGEIRDTLARHILRAQLKFQQAYENCVDQLDSCSPGPTVVDHSRLVLAFESTWTHLMSRMHGILLEAVAVESEAPLKHEHVSHPTLLLTLIAHTHLSNVDQFA